FPHSPFSATGILPSLRYDGVRVHPGMSSASFRKQRSPSPESPLREAQFSGVDREYFQSFAPGSVSLLPAIGKPGVDVVYRSRGKIHQQLPPARDGSATLLHATADESSLVPAAAAGQAQQVRERQKKPGSKPRFTW